MAPDTLSWAWYSLTHCLVLNDGISLGISLHCLIIIWSSHWNKVIYSHRVKVTKGSCLCRLKVLGSKNIYTEYHYCTMYKSKQLQAGLKCVDRRKDGRPSERLLKMIVQIHSTLWSNVKNNYALQRARVSLSVFHSGL